MVAPVILSGFVLGAPQPADDSLEVTRPPVFWGRGAREQMIAAPAISRTESWLPAHTDPTRHVYPGLAHGINADEIADPRAFLNAHISPM